MNQPATPVDTSARFRLKDGFDNLHFTPERVQELCPAMKGEQPAALAKILNWFVDQTAEPEMVLDGPAGTGKTWTARELVNFIRGEMVFTAPTNKATNQLRASVTSDTYTPACCTIYSLLGLTMAANGEVKELAVPEDPMDLSTLRLCIVDEAYMLNKQVRQILLDSARFYRYKILYMGDRYQLPPVGEAASSVTELPDEQRAVLTKVLRHDNAILELATQLREKVFLPFPQVNIATNLDSSGEGVKRVSVEEAYSIAREALQNGLFDQPFGMRVLAWRNVTVQDWNRRIRAWKHAMNYPQGIPTWLPEDRVIFRKPAWDLDQNRIATTDEEGVIHRVETDVHPTYPQVTCYRITLQLLDAKAPIVAWVPTERGAETVAKEKDRMSAAARVARDKRQAWKEFWAFVEAFHEISHASALTIHRAQGSTYERVLVIGSDILLNRTMPEKMQCLYTACTRPKKYLYYV